MTPARRVGGLGVTPRRPGTSERGGIIFRLMVLLFLACFVFVIYLIRHPLMRLAGNFWVVDDSPAASDAIVVLGDDNYEGDRAARAAEVLKQGWAPRIIASGRYLRPYASIAQLEKQDLIERGVPASAIVMFAHRAENTREEGELLGKFIAAHGWKRILVVTSNYHTRRARYILERVLPPGTVLRVLSAPDVNYDPDNWWRTRRGVKLFFHECVGMVVAMWELRNRHPRTSTIGSLSVGPAGIDDLGSFGLRPSYGRLQPTVHILYFLLPQTTDARCRVMQISVGEVSHVAQTRRQAIFGPIPRSQFCAAQNSGANRSSAKASKRRRAVRSPGVARGCGGRRIAGVQDWTGSPNSRRDLRPLGPVS